MSTHLVPKTRSKPSKTVAYNKGGGIVYTNVNVGATIYNNNSNTKTPVCTFIMQCQSFLRRMPNVHAVNSGGSALIYP